MGQKYLTLLNHNDLSNIIDRKAKNIINFLLFRSVFAQPENINSDQKNNFTIPREHLEQWICQATGYNPTGAGNYPVDAISFDKKSAIDIAGVTLKFDSKGHIKNAESGEKSLSQKFSDDNYGEQSDTLDDLFSSGQYDLISEDFNKIYYEKFKKVKSDYPSLENIVYIFFMISRNTLYLTGFKVNYENKLSNVVLKSTSSSIWCGQYIDENYGTAKIYKAKKRLELRLRPKSILDEKCFISFNLESKDSVALRNLSPEELVGLYKYQLEILEKKYNLNSY